MTCCKINFTTETRQKWRNPILSWKVSHPSSEKYESMGLGETG
jgi:hypothetical protein